MACVGFANGFAVPASTFGVRLAGEAGVSFTCPGESIVEFDFGNFVVVVDELSALRDGIFHVLGWVELMCVPGEVDVESWDSHLERVLSHDGHEVAVFCDQAVHCVG